MMRNFWKELKEFRLEADVGLFCREMATEIDTLRASKDSVFIDHIQDHLEEGQEVICKICGKSAKAIIEEEGS